MGAPCARRCRSAAARPGMVEVTQGVKRGDNVVDARAAKSARRRAGPHRRVRPPIRHRRRTSRAPRADSKRNLGTAWSSPTPRSSGRSSRPSSAFCCSCSASRPRPSCRCASIPAIDPPVVQVTTTYRGASNEVMESAGDARSSRPRSPASRASRPSPRSAARSARAVNIEFLLSRNIDAARRDVRDRLGRIMSQLPSDVDPPAVAKLDADARPILWFTLTSDRTIAAGADRLCRALPGRPAVDRAGRRLGRHRRRAALRHARLARPPRHGRAQPDRRGHRDRASSATTSSCPRGRIEVDAARVHGQDRLPAHASPERVLRASSWRRATATRCGSARWRGSRSAREDDRSRDARQRPARRSASASCASRRPTRWRSPTAPRRR